MCCASLTTQFNTVSLLLSLESITIQLFLLFPSWNQLPGMASNQQLVTEVTEACYTVFFCILYVLPERRCSVWGSLHPHFSLVQCLMIEKHLWWPLIASCLILIGNVWHFPCNWWSIAFKLWSSNWGKTWRKNKLALMGSLHAAASVMVEFYSACFEI